MRSEEERLAGLLTVQLGESQKTLRVLRIDKAREWQQQIAGILGPLGQLDFTSAGGLGSLLAMGSDALLDLATGYDVDQVLGDRARLEQNATVEQLYAVVRDMWEATFPFVRDAAGLLAQLMELRKMGAPTTESPSVSPSSTNGRPTPGTSTRKPSKVG